MKKWITIILALSIMCTFGACGIGTAGKPDGEEIPVTETEEPIIIGDANEILEKTWSQYNMDASKDFHFGIIGGHVESNIVGWPAKFDMELESSQDALAEAYALDADTVALTDDIATMMHLMRAHYFAASAVHVTDAANTQTVVDGIRSSLDAMNWMGDVPEAYLIVTVNEDYVVTVYGNEQVIELFRRAIVKAYPEVTEVVINIG